MSDYYTEEAEYFRQKIEFEKSFEDTYGVTFDRIRELAEAEREGRILILWKPIEENDGMFTVLYRRHDGVLMGRTDRTAEEAVKNATADYDAH